MLTPHDLHLIKRDTQLAHLRDLLDSERYSALLKSRIPESDISNVTLTYLRYKPGVNCIAGYEYRLDGQTYFAYAKIFSDNQVEKREKFNARAAINAQMIPDAEGISVSFFPADSRLRALKKLDGGEKEQLFIQRIFSKQEALWAGKITPIRYKPERRYVSRLSLDGQDRAVIKIHTGNSYAKLRDNNKAFISIENLNLAKCIGRSDRHRVLAFEWLPGQLLSDVLRGGQLAAETLLPVGSALGHIHSQKADLLQVNSPEMQADHIQAVAEQTMFLCPDLGEALKKTASQICALLRDGRGSYAASHGDFYAKQVLIQGDQIGVLDFDESAFADPMSDLGNFLAHLERDHLRFQISESSLDDYQQAFLEGYNATGLSINKQHLASYFAANLFKLIPHPFRFRESNWPEQTALLLDRVQRILIDAKSTTHFAAANNAQSAPLLAKDEGLPFLNTALDCEAALPAISEALQAAYPQHSIEQITQAQLLRHKPGRRCLIEYTVQLRDNANAFSNLLVLGKARHKKLDASNYDLVQKLWQGPFHVDASDGISVPAPLGKAPAFNMWLQQKITGYTATNYLDQPAAVVMARDIAKALHKLNTRGPASHRVHDMQDELSILDTRLALVADAHAAWRSRIAHVMITCRELAELLPEAAPQPVHRDFYPDNILISSEGIHLLDLDLYCMGDPALDAGNFIGHVMEYSLRKHGDPNAMNTCVSAFEDAFVGLTGAYIRPAVHVYTTLTIARHIQISTLFDDRKAFTESLISLAEQRLENHMAAHNLLSNLTI